MFAFASISDFTPRRPRDHRRRESALATSVSRLIGRPGYCRSRRAIDAIGHHGALVGVGLDRRQPLRVRRELVVARRLCKDGRRLREPDRDQQRANAHGAQSNASVVRLPAYGLSRRRQRPRFRRDPVLRDRDPWARRFVRAHESRIDRRQRGHRNDRARSRSVGEVRFRILRAWNRRRADRRLFAHDRRRDRCRGGA